jgi:hypothetical protein
MRRVVVELPRDDFVRLKRDIPFYRALESLAVLQILRAGPGGASSIIRIRPKDSGLKFEDLVPLAPGGLQLLEASDDGSFVCLRTFGRTPLHDRLGLRRTQGYFVPPIEVDGETARMTYVGSSKDVGQLFRGLRSAGLRFRTLSLSDMRLPLHSPLNTLTEKQRRVVTTAFRYGYYDRPRRISSQALARALGLSSSTLVNHRLKAERRLLSAVFDEEPLARPARRS